MTVSQDHAPTNTAVTSGHTPLPRFAIETADFKRGRVTLKGRFPGDGRDLHRLLRLLVSASDLLEALKLAEGLPELIGEIEELEMHGGADDARVLKALRKELTAIRASARAAIAKAEAA